MPNVPFVSRESPPVRYQRRLLLCFLLCSALFAGGGCSTYQNITGYFNTYYNAKKLFSQAVSEVEAASEKSRDSAYITPYKIAPPQAQKFDKVIEKCSKIIESYDKSSWVDDALLMIGISYVYKDENEAAERKFRELMDNFPESDLRRQAKLWYAKAEYFMGKPESALKLTSELFDDARSEGDNDVLFEMLMLEAQIANERGEYTVAADKYTLAAQVSVDDQLRARAQYQLANTEEKLGDWLKASEAYRDVQKFGPPFPLEFQSRLRYGRMLTLAQQYDRALNVLDALFDEQLKVEERSLVDLELANTHWARGDSVDAYALYTLIDTVYPRSDASAKAYYKRGVISEETFRDFKGAQTYYTKAKDQYAQSEVVPSAQKKVATFGNYFRHYEDMVKYDSLFTVRLHLDSAMANGGSAKTNGDSLAGAALSRPDSGRPASPSDLFTVALHADSSAEPSLEHPLANIPDSLSQGLVAPPDNALEAEDEEPAKRDERLSAEAGEEPALSDSLGGRHDRSLIREKEMLRRRKGAKLQKELPGTKAKALPALPVAPLSADSLKELLAQTKFELGGILLLELQLPDSALYWFQRVIREHPLSRIVPRTLYAMTEIYRLKNDTATVDSLYEVLSAKYEKTEYAAQAKKFLGIEGETAFQDSALLQYNEAVKLLEQQDSHEALEKLRQIIVQYAHTPFKPKAMYMMGWIYENVKANKANIDSAAAWYERLLKDYPTSVYAAEVQPKLAVKADPKSLSQFVKITEIKAVQPASATRVANKANRPKDKEEEDEELIHGRRNRDRDVEDDDQEDQDEPDQDADDDSDDNQF